MIEIITKFKKVLFFATLKLHRRKANSFLFHHKFDPKQDKICKIWINIEMSQCKLSKVHSPIKQSSKEYWTGNEREQTHEH